MSLQRTLPPDPYQFLPERPGFEVASEDVEHGAPLDMAHVYTGAGGADQSPQLSWRGFPEETRSFAVTCFDPDAPTLSGWWHWFVVNIPVDVTSLQRGAGRSDSALMPRGAVQLRNDYGSFGFGGCGPPQGDPAHRYFFVVHALDTDHLDVDPAAPVAPASMQVTVHTLARGMILGTFQH